MVSFRRSLSPRRRIHQNAPLFIKVISRLQNRHIFALENRREREKENARRFTHRDGPEWERRLGRAPGSVHVADQTVRFLFTCSFFRIA